VAFPEAQSWWYRQRVAGCVLSKCFFCFLGFFWSGQLEEKNGRVGQGGGLLTLRIVKKYGSLNVN
jgi:hypothetical protein